MKLGSKYDLHDTPCILFVKKYFFFMHIFNMSATYVQRVEKMVNNPESWSKHIFSASNFFMNVFNMSATYFQNVEKIQWKL